MGNCPGIRGCSCSDCCLLPCKSLTWSTCPCIAVYALVLQCKSWCYSACPSVTVHTLMSQVCITVHSAYSSIVTHMHCIQMLMGFIIILVVIIIIVTIIMVSITIVVSVTISIYYHYWGGAADLCLPHLWDHGHSLGSQAGGHLVYLQHLRALHHQSALPGLDHLCGCSPALLCKCNLVHSVSYDQPPSLPHTLMQQISVAWCTGVAVSGELANTVVCGFLCIVDAADV